MKHNHSKNSLFLMEIILNLLLFSLLMVASLQLVIKAHTLTAQTRDLHRAVSSCASAAAVFESGDGTLDDFLDYYGYSVNLNSRILIYLDGDFNECQSDRARYYLTVTPMDTADNLAKVTIVCRTMQDEELYSLTACHYRQLELEAFSQGEEVPL